MSRIGKKVWTIPAGVSVEMVKNELVAKGPNGVIKTKIHPRVSIIVDGENITVKVVDENLKSDRALWGTFSSLVNNMLLGVTVGFKKSLDINGVGFKAFLKGEDLVLEVGFSHPVVIKSLPGIKLSVDKNIITVEGVEKQVVGEIAAQIRAVKKVEPYKGKGIKYVGEEPRRKAGKTAAKAAS